MIKIVFFFATFIFVVFVVLFDFTFFKYVLIKKTKNNFKPSDKMINFYHYWSSFFFGSWLVVLFCLLMKIHTFGSWFPLQRVASTIQLSLTKFLSLLFERSLLYYLNKCLLNLLFPLNYNLIISVEYQSKILRIWYWCDDRLFDILINKYNIYSIDLAKLAQFLSVCRVQQVLWLIE